MKVLGSSALIRVISGKDFGCLLAAKPHPCWPSWDAKTARAHLQSVPILSQSATGSNLRLIQSGWLPRGYTILTSTLPGPPEHAAAKCLPGSWRIHGTPPQPLRQRYAGCVDTAAWLGFGSDARHRRWPKRVRHAIQQWLARSIQECFLYKLPD